MIEEQDYRTVSLFVGQWAKGQERGRVFSTNQFYQLINAPHPMHDSAFRRLLVNLEIKKNPQGKYNWADVAVVVGWLTAVDPETGKRFFNSCSEYMECSGKKLYKASEGLDFSDFKVNVGVAA